MPEHRVLHVIPRLPVNARGTLIGGSASILVALARAQSQRDDHQVAIWTGATARDGSLAALLGRGVQGNSVRLLSPPSSGAYGLELTARAAMGACRSGADGFSPTLVHGHSGRWQYALTTWAVAARLHRPWIHTFYCPVGAPSLGARIARAVLSRARCLVGISRNVVASVARAGVSPDLLYHIPPGIDLSKWQPQGSRERIRQQLGIPPGAQAALFVGNADRSKGYDILFRAFQLARRTIPDLYLVATLEKKGRSDQTTICAAASGDNHLRFLGVVDDMPALMESADVLVLPFRHTFGPSDYPVPMLEAMAVGTPVIAAAVGGIPEVMRHRQTGLLVPPGDEEALSAALVEYFSGSVDRRMLAASARQLVMDRFSSERTADQWSRLYEDVAA